ncbi:MAG TPA: hypothetical protein VHB21_19400 [Minicystis sp.]|nr:hypothetical protein [Minicystis sp.]
MKFLRAILVLPVAAALLAGCAASDPTDSSESIDDGTDALSSLGGPISRTEVLARAQNWVNWHVMYSQDQSSPYGDGDGHSYRRDCSGYVSMAWHLAKKSGGWDLNTWDFGSTNLKQTLGSYDDLEPGDALNGVDYGHIVLFDKWANASHTEMWIYQESDYGLPAEHVEQGVSWYHANGFVPIRYVHIEGGTPPSGGGGGGDACDVHADGKLYCDNTTGAAMYSSTNTSSGVVNHLRTSPSWFKCWGTGQLHAGGNTTWYYTEGDDNSKWGWVPAVDLHTTSAFDANPSAHGLAKCGGGSPPPPDPANCSVHSDGRLHCDNTAGAPLRSAPTNSSSVVNHLRTTNSWFTCWKDGDLHAGGNHTWYYTEGDDNTHWGYVPAVDLDTTSAFDANPSAHGLPACH